MYHMVIIVINIFIRKNKFKFNLKAYKFKLKAEQIILSLYNDYFGG